jgi:hypothetical protein
MNNILGGRELNFILHWHNGSNLLVPHPYILSPADIYTLFWYFYYVKFMMLGMII